MCRAYAFICCRFFFLNYTATTEIYTYGHTLSLHDALPISARAARTPSGANSGPKSFVRTPSRRGPAAPTRTAIRGCAWPGTRTPTPTYPKTMASTPFNAERTAPTAPTTPKPSTHATADRESGVVGKRVKLRVKPGRCQIK